MKEFTEKLFAMRDADYAAFTAKLVPDVNAQRIIGVRLPALRLTAKELIADSGYKDFLRELPHGYHDENMLHACLISLIGDYGTCIEETERFLPYIDNWAVCDSLRPKVFSENKGELIGRAREWAYSGHTYTCRFGLEMLMLHFLDDKFKTEYIEIPAEIKSDEYYVNMMIAWFYATALAKQWDCAIPYIENNRLGVWVHNKTIQKSCESFRITAEQKEYLRGLRRKY